MKITTIVCCALLLFFGICASTFALTGFNLLLFLCAGHEGIYRAVLSLQGVAALWLLFFLCAFRPTKYVS